MVPPGCRGLRRRAWSRRRASAAFYARRWSADRCLQVDDPAERAAAQPLMAASPAGGRTSMRQHNDPTPVSRLFVSLSSRGRARYSAPRHHRTKASAGQGKILHMARSPTSAGGNFQGVRAGASGRIVHGLRERFEACRADGFTLRPTPCRAASATPWPGSVPNSAGQAWSGGRPRRRRPGRSSACRTPPVGPPRRTMRTPVDHRAPETV